MLTGWTTEMYGNDRWWNPPIGSPILRKLLSTKLIDNAVGYQKREDGLESYN